MCSAVDAPKQVRHIDAGEARKTFHYKLLPQPKTALCLANITSNVDIPWCRHKLLETLRYGFGLVKRSPARKLRRAPKTKENKTMAELMIASLPCLMP